jgi:hypothetical protein
MASTQDMRRRLAALEAAGSALEDDRPLRINLIAYDPDHSHGGEIACSWVRDAGERNYRHVMGGECP